MKTYTMCLTIGDWSQDGHNQFEKIVIKSNEPLEKVRCGYMDSCKLTGLAFHNLDKLCVTHRKLQNNTEYPKLDGMLDQNSYSCAWDYQKPISDKFVTEIAKHGIIIDKENGYSTKDFAEYWFKFVKLSLINFEWEIIEIPSINGYWQNEFNFSLGYGLYS